MPEIHVGLCAACAHQKIIRSGRGSEFSMCLRHRDDPGYPKYPRIPVGECRGYERRAPEDPQTPCLDNTR